MLNRESPEDFVVATGVTQSLREFVKTVFEEAGLDWRNHVIIDPSLHRPSDPNVIIGDSAKAKKLLHWQPKVVGSEIPRKMFHEIL
jgi:GDPmannose 4,6-dehydratase